MIKIMTRKELIELFQYELKIVEEQIELYEKSKLDSGSSLSSIPLTMLLISLTLEARRIESKIHYLYGVTDFDCNSNLRKLIRNR